MIGRLNVALSCVEADEARLGEIFNCYYFGMRHVGLLHTESHWPDKPLKLRRFPRERLSDECMLGDDALPGLAAPLARRKHLHDLVLTHCPDFWQRNAPFSLRKYKDPPILGT